MTSVVQHPVVGIAGNVVSAATILASFAGWLPPLAALAAIIWYAIAIWESETVRTWRQGREYVQLKKRQEAAARVLKTAQEANAKALLAWQEAEAKALRIRQAAGVAPSSSSTEAAPSGLEPPTPHP